LECADLSALWSAATCRILRRLNSLAAAASSRRGQKALTGQHTPKSDIWFLKRF
jgi:hypothetical protein